MSQFRSTGGLDEPIYEDMDRGFQSINQRLQLNQLQEFEVRESLNGRMEGYWKPRKGVVEKTGTLTTGSIPLQLPFHIFGSSVTITAATITGGVVTLTTGSAHGLGDGSVLTTEGIGYTSGTNPNGTFTATTASGTSIKYPLAGGIGPYTVTSASRVVTTAKTITAATVTGGVVTITTPGSHGFSAGDFVSIEGVGFSTGVSPNGRFQLVSVTTTQFTYALVGGSGTYTVTNGRAYDLSKTITNAAYLNDLVTLTVASHGITVGQVGNVSLSGVSFTGVDYNGVVPVTAATINTLTFPTSGVTNATSGASSRITQLLINDVANANVRASCLFSDPNTNNKEFVIVAMDTVAKKIDLETLAITDIPYPAGQAIGSDTEMIQLFDKVMLFRDGQQALEWFPNGRQILSALSNGTASPNTVVTVNMLEHGLLVGTSITISGLTGGTPPNGTYVVASIPTQDSFTFLASGISLSTTFVATDATATDGFTLSPGGAYTQPQTFNITAKEVDILDGIVTAEVVGNVTIKVGDIIVVRQTATLDFAEMVGKEYQVIEATTTIIKWYAPVGNYDTSSTDVFEFGGRFSVGGGFMHQPAAPWGVHFQRRLWVPYYYDQSGLFNAPVYTSRKITDEISVSDILDTTTFDQIESQFRISGGTADYVVGMHGFYDDALVVLNRNSLHLVKGTLGSLLDCTVKELTSEIGCLARKSVVMRGNTMMFLSDDGVYSLEFLNDYNLRGSDEPISKNIQPYIDRINKNFAAEAVGILFDNRYYLTVALDSSVGANDARGNNSILVYNFKNQGWESLDTYGDSRFLIKNLITGGAGIRNELYAVTRNGGLHQIDATESSVDRLNVQNVGGELVTPTINSSLTTRGYDLKTMERKRFTDAQILMQNLAGDTGEYLISFAAEDPDNASEIGTTTQFLGGALLSPSTQNEAETASIRCRLAGIRGYTGTLILTRTIGSPKINSVKVAGSVTNRQIISQR